MYVKCSIFKNNIAFRTLRSQTFQWEKKETPSSQNRDPNNQLVKLKLAVLEIQMSPSSPASWGALQGSVKSARPEHIEKCQQRCRSSVTKSPVYRRARPSRRAYVKNLWFEGTYFEYHYCLLFFWSNCQMCPLNQLFAQTMIAVIERLQNFSWPPFRPRLLWEKQPTLVLIVCSTLPPLPPQQPCPIPFSLSPCEPRLFWQNQLAELIFKKKKPRQNWSRGHFEATQKANFSILKPNFWSGDTAMGMAHWHNPKRVNFFSNILQNHYFVR